MEETVSVIVPIHNAGLYLQECLESVCNQDYPALEIILVDDASDDQSGEVCKNFQRMDARIVFIEHDFCAGVSKTRNDGLDIATGVYVAFIDADDVVAPDFIRLMVANIGGHDIAISAYKKFAANYEKKYILDVSQIATWNQLMFHVLCTNRIGGYCFNKLYRRTLLEGIRFDQSLTMGEDFCFVLQYLRHCRTYSYIDKPLYYYRVNPNSATQLGKTKRILDLNKISYLEAVNKLSKLMKNESSDLQPYVSYRVVRGNVWVMLQFIYSGTYPKDVVKKIRNTIRRHYSQYRKAHHGSLFQKMAVLGVILSPNMLFISGSLILRVWPQLFRKVTLD